MLIFPGMLHAAGRNGVAPPSAESKCASCPEMVVIPAGSFEMGSPASETGRSDAEAPVHRVSLQSFSLSKTHITRGQFAAFVKDTGYDTGDQCFTFEDGTWDLRHPRSWRAPGFAQDDRHPAVCINLDDALAYTQWLSKKTGKHYRLPTEAELEYATRAGTATARYWGDNADQACAYANAMDSTGKSQVHGARADALACDDGYAYTAPVASFKPNGFGLYDMLGNVWQWTEDFWHDNYVGAPADGEVWNQGGDLRRRILRGGSWDIGPNLLRSAARSRGVSTARGSSVGFRVVATAP